MKKLHEKVRDRRGSLLIPSGAEATGGQRGTLTHGTKPSGRERRPMASIVCERLAVALPVVPATRTVDRALGSTDPQATVVIAFPCARGSCCPPSARTP